MPVFHFLNVKNGDCSIIQHLNGNVSVIDVCNAKPSFPQLDSLLLELSKTERGISGNFNQKEYPVNPVTYLESFGISSVFRFILTHPDMDHMDGIKCFFENFSPLNFWDSNNTVEKEDWSGSPYSAEDWEFYKALRDSRSEANPKRLALYANARGKYFNVNEDGNSGGDGLYVLAPTPSLLQAANACGEYNDSSYVILYKTFDKKILIAGDSEDDTWEYILKNHADDVRNVDVYLASHHGRDSGRSFEFLDTVNPAITLFGNASSDHLAYGPFYNRGLDVITNNQANCILVNIGASTFDLYVTHEQFARKRNEFTFYSDSLRAWYCGPINR